MLITPYQAAATMAKARADQLAYAVRALSDAPIISAFLPRFGGEEALIRAGQYAARYAAAGRLQAKYAGQGHFARADYFEALQQEILQAFDADKFLAACY